MCVANRRCHPHCLQATVGRQSCHYCGHGQRSGCLIHRGCVQDCHHDCDCVQGCHHDCDCVQDCLYGYQHLDCFHEHLHWGLHPDYRDYCRDCQLPPHSVYDQDWDCYRGSDHGCCHQRCCHHLHCPHRPGWVTKTSGPW